MSYRFVPVNVPDDTPERESWWSRNRTWIMLYVVRPIVVIAALAFILCGGFIFLLPFAMVRKNRQQRRVRVAVTTQTQTVDPRNPYDNL